MFTPSWRDWMAFQSRLIRMNVAYDRKTARQLGQALSLSSPTHAPHTKAMTLRRMLPIPCINSNSKIACTVRLQQLMSNQHEPLFEPRLRCETLSAPFVEILGDGLPALVEQDRRPTILMTARRQSCRRRKPIRKW